MCWVHLWLADSVSAEGFALRDKWRICNCDSKKEKQRQRLSNLIWSETFTNPQLSFIIWSHLHWSNFLGSPKSLDIILQITCRFLINTFKTLDTSMLLCTEFNKQHQCFYIFPLKKRQNIPQICHNYTTKVQYIEQKIMDTVMMNLVSQILGDGFRGVEESFYSSSKFCVLIMSSSHWIPHCLVKHSLVHLWRKWWIMNHLTISVFPLTSL